MPTDDQQKRRDQLMRINAGMATGLAGGLSGAYASKNVTLPLYSKALAREFSDVALSADQLRAMRDELSSGTHISELDEMHAVDNVTGKTVPKTQMVHRLKDYGAYNPGRDAVIGHRTLNGGTLRGQIMAHELGHARLHKKPIIGDVIRFGRGAQNPVALASAIAAGTLAGAATDENDPRKRVADVAQFGGAAAVAPELFDEGYASLKGYQALKKHVPDAAVRRAARKDLLRAFGTYSASAAPLIAAPFAAKAVASRIRDRMKERQNQRKS